MPEYVIEREVPGAGNLTEDEIREVSLRSLAVLKELRLQHSVAAQLRHRREDLLCILRE